MIYGAGRGSVGLGGVVYGAAPHLFPPPRPLLLSEDEEDTKRVVRSAKDKR